MTSKPLYKVPIGAHLILDGVTWLVVGEDMDGYAVEGREDGEFATFTIEHVQRAIAKNNCEVIKPAQIQKRKELLDYTGGFERIEQLSADEQTNVRARLALVRAVEALEQEDYKITQRWLSREDIRDRVRRIACDLAEDKNLFRDVKATGTTSQFIIPKGRTLKEWVDVFRRFDRNPIVLMHRHHLKGPPEHLRSRLNKHQERFIDYVINLVLDGKKPQIAPLFELAKEQFHVCEEAVLGGFEFPSIVTVRTRYKAISTIIKEIGREGIKATRNKHGAGSKDIRALMFGEKAAMDQCYLSIFVSGKGDLQAKEIDPEKVGEELEDHEIRRVWLHFMIDIATRSALGWVLSETADSDSAMALIRMAMRDKTKEKVRYGCQADPAPPVSLMATIADNGTATRTESIYAAMLGAGISVETNRAYISTDNAYVERAFGTLQFQVLNLMKGYTGSRPGELPNEDPMKEADWALDRLYGTITRYFIDEYPHKAHRGTGMFGATPKQKLRDAQKMYGPIDPPSPRDRRLHLGIQKVYTTSSEGVLVFGIPFNSDALQKLHDGKPKRVTTYLDPDDIRKISISAEGKTEIIEADLKMTALADQTIYEALGIMTSAALNDPDLKVIDDAIIKHALKRRGTESGYFPDSRLPSSYGKISYLEKQAEAIEKVEVRPPSRVPWTTSPGSVMDRSSATTSFVTRAGSTDPASEPSTPQPKRFGPLKESKI